MTSKKSFSILLLIASIAVSIAFFVFKDYFKDFKNLGLLGIFLINFFSSATFFVSGPAFLTVIAGGAIYNPLLVAFIASLGASIGDMVSFFVGFSGRNIAIAGLKKKLWFIVLEDVFKAYGVFFIFIIALIPNPFFDAVGLLAGTLGMDYKKFFVTMLTGRFARYILLAFLGSNFY